MWRAVCAGAVAFGAFGASGVGCGHPREVAPQQRDNAMVVSPPAAAADAREASEDERLAAIQKAMNELRGAAQECWAAAATERFDIEGELTYQIAISAGKAQASAVHDTARNTRLSTCVARLLAAYPWAPPLIGQTIQLPFKFRAPDGQSTIDRALVAWNGQGSGSSTPRGRTPAPPAEPSGAPPPATRFSSSNISVAVLLDENNTGNDAASMFELAIAAGSTTGLRRADRAELWYFLGAGKVAFGAGQHAVAAGDMMYAPKGAVREVAATTDDLHAVIVMVPGGREGAARSGALPTREVASAAGAPVPTLLPAAAARTSTAIHDAALSASLVTVAANTRLAEHVHAGETELWYVLAGTGTLTVNGIDLPVTATTVVQIPRTTRHALAATADIRALQIFTPAGPEQRIKARP